MLVVLGIPQFISMDTLKLKCIIRKAYKSYLAHLNTFLSLACRHVKIGRYGQKRLLILLGTS